ncbi:PDZ domain-containing protein, partial [Kibdelosporangium lantanae]
LFIVIVLAILGAVVPVPFVALGPGPTYNTLGDVNGTEIVQVDGTKTYPTTGQLRMTTVSLKRDVTLFGAFGLWVSGRYALAPREEYIKPGQTEEQVQQENVQMFQDSQSDAEVASLRYLGNPVKVVVNQVTQGAPADKIIQPGDRLVSVNGHDIHQQDDVVDSVKDTRPGQAIPVVLERNGTRQTVTITLGKAPDDRPQGFMGISGVDRADVPFASALFKATHNSYSGDVDGAKHSITYQLDNGVRFVEFDVHDNGYATNHDYGIGHNSPGDAVDHNGNPASNNLRDWMTVVSTWSGAHPTHAPIVVMLDLKDDLTDNPNYSAGNMTALNQEITSVFGGKLLPAKDYPGALPSVDALRGRVIVLLSGDGGSRTEYKRDVGHNPA